MTCRSSHDDELELMLLWYKGGLIPAGSSGGPLAKDLPFLGFMFTQEEISKYEDRFFLFGWSLMQISLFPLTSNLLPSFPMNSSGS